MKKILAALAVAGLLVVAQGCATKNPSDFPYIE